MQNSMLKKFASLLLVLTLSLSMFTMTAFAAEATPVLTDPELSATVGVTVTDYVMANTGSPAATWGYVPASGAIPWWATFAPTFGTEGKISWTAPPASVGAVATIGIVAVNGASSPRATQTLTLTVSSAAETFDGVKVSGFKNLETTTTLELLFSGDTGFPSTLEIGDIEVHGATKLSLSTAGGKCVLTIGGVTSQDQAVTVEIMNNPLGYEINGVAYDGSTTATIGTTLNKLYVSSDSGNSSNSSGGSGSGSSGAASGSSNVAGDGAVSPTAIQAEANEALNEAGSDAVLKTRNAQTISADTLKALANAANKAGKNLILHADTTSPNGKSVEGRLYVDPSKLGSLNDNLNLAVYTRKEKTLATKNLFEKWFDNKIAVINCGQQGSFGGTLKIAAKVDLDGLDIDNLLFFSYNRKTNTYTRIGDARYFVDANGYLHFFTSLGYDIVISDSSFAN